MVVVGNVLILASYSDLPVALRIVITFLIVAAAGAVMLGIGAAIYAYVIEPLQDWWFKAREPARERASDRREVKRRANYAARQEAAKARREIEEEREKRDAYRELLASDPELRKAHEEKIRRIMERPESIDPDSRP